MRLTKAMSEIETATVVEVGTDPVEKTENEREVEMREEIERLRELLQSQTENNITDQMWLWVLDCKLRRNAYWKQYYRYQKYNNVLSTPLTLIASATGITSIAQLGYEGTSISIAVAVLGVMSTALTAYQRYFNWGQKALHCRDIAKRYTVLARRGEMQINLYMTKRITMDLLQEFMEEFRKELDSVQTETEELPDEILNRRNLADPEMSSAQLRNLAMQEDSDCEDDRRVDGRRIMFSKAMPPSGR